MEELWNIGGFMLKGVVIFFTVVLADRKSELLVTHINLLRESIKKVKAKHPFHIDAMVVMPDHLHCIWTMPENDSNYSKRWMLIKRNFSLELPKSEFIKTTRFNKRERGIWQRRFWEHKIRDERDYINHVEYIHNNPVKHKYVQNAIDWPHSSIHKFKTG